MSTWDGNHDDLENLIRPLLNDPSSMETFSTRISPVGEEGQHTLIMDHGARNAFGGMVRATAIVSIDHESCEIVDIDTLGLE